MGAASAAEDVSTDAVDASADAVAVDAVSEDASDSLESVVEDEPVVDESAPAQDVELEASVDEEPAVVEVSGQSQILGDTETIINSDDYDTPKKFRQALNSLISSSTGNTTIIIKGRTKLDRFSQNNPLANITFIVEDKENWIFDVEYVLGSDDENNRGNTITWVNCTFTKEITLSDSNHKFINCTFLNLPIDFGKLREEQLKDKNSIDVFNYAFENCYFINYTQDIIVGHKFANITISNCIFDNITTDAIVSTNANRTDDSGRQAGVIIKDSTFKDVTINGVAKVQTELLSNVKVEDCEYIGFEATTNPVEDGDYTYLNATKLKVVAVDSAVDISSPEKGVVVITLTDNSTNPIAGATFKYSVNGEEKTDVTGEDGKFTISGLTGEVTIAVNYEGNESYNPIQDSQVFNFTEEPVIPAKVATKISAAKVTATYNVAKKLVITLKDANGKALANQKVTVKVGTISKTLKTDKNGQVSLNVATLVPKTYTATFSFAGDGSYLKSSSSVKVVVKKAAPKLTAKAKTFKVKAKVKKYTATLKDNKGKAIKKAKLTLKIGKKTYTANTNAKGVATFKVKLTKKGKNTATVKFAGNKYFKAISKKVKITVKK